MTVNVEKELCLKLIHADTEHKVIEILDAHGYWADASFWRPLGGDVNNYSSAGNQQSRAEQAIIEKLVNAIDTKLMAACYMAGIDAKSDKAPASMLVAREKFFADKLKDQETLSKSICVSATGKRPQEGRPSFTIVDDGEGQTPEGMHGTILSLHAGNKKQVPFVQGKFNMGGTGVLEFCGDKRNVQLIVSKRNPSLSKLPAGNDDRWSFTVIRRDDPDTPGGTSKFVYLAPVSAAERPKKGDLLAFKADTLPIFPEQKKAYAREASWGTLFKLYEYEAKRFATHILRDGLMDRVRVLLPEPALPIRFHECRDGYKGHEGSFDTTMVGLVRTLLDDVESDKRNNVEWHDQIEFRVAGEKFSARIFVFRDKKVADGYRKDEGVVFSYNGQCHATLSKDFFRRKRVKQDYLWHSLIMIVDCSMIGPRAHEELFMNSRDRLRDKQLKRDLEEQIEDILANHEELRQLANERRKKELASKPNATESMAKVISDLLQKNPALANLLGMGTRIQDPHRPTATGGGTSSFEGKRFPTYFRFKGRETGAELARDANLNSHCRITFETDAENDYFRREDEHGEFELFVQRDGGWQPAENFQRPRLHNGFAHLSLALPLSASVGDIYRFKATLTDASRVDELVNEFTLSVKPEAIPGNGTGGQRSGRNDSEDKGNEGKGDKPDKQQPTFLDIPNPIPIEKSQWESQTPAFDKYTALRITPQPTAPGEPDAWDYRVNVDNVYLQNFLVSKLSQAETIKLRFQVAMVLVGLSALHQRRLMESGQSAEDFPSSESNVSDMVQNMTSAIAPFLLPMIESVGELEVPDEELSDSAGEAS